MTTDGMLMLMGIGDRGWQADFQRQSRPRACVHICYERSFVHQTTETPVYFFFAFR